MTVADQDHKHCLHFTEPTAGSDMDCCLCPLKVKRVVGELPEEFTIGAVSRLDCKRKVA